VTKPKAKRKGIVVTVTRRSRYFHHNCIVQPRDGGYSVDICYRYLVRAGMKPLKPGESRKVRVTVEDV
jgi:hypothetical protein